MHIARLITLAIIASILTLIVIVDVLMSLWGNGFIVSTPMHVLALVAGCMFWLLFEGHRRFDQFDKKMTAKLERVQTADDLECLGLRHGSQLRTLNG